MTIFKDGQLSLSVANGLPKSSKKKKKAKTWATSFYKVMKKQPVTEQHIIIRFERS